LAALKVIEIGPEHDVHPGALGQFRRHVDAGGALGVLVNLLQGDDFCVGLSEDVGDALKIYLTVQSLGVVDVVGHHAQNHWRDIR
jgi:hypothetical protein